MIFIIVVHKILGFLNNEEYLYLHSVSEDAG